jgi:hypothetical protein
MANDTEDMGLAALLVNGKSLIIGAILRITRLYGANEMHGIPTRTRTSRMTLKVGTSYNLLRQQQRK